MTVPPIRQSAQNRRRLTLRPCDHKHHFMRRQIPRPPNVHQHIIIDIEIAELAGDFGVFRHGIAGDADLAPMVLGGIDDLLHPRNQ